jgi:hypothetical protein
MTHSEQPNQVTKDAEVASTWWNDRYLAYIPLLGAAVALSFDVGCFYAIQINLFTMFTLSEHIVVYAFGAYCICNTSISNCPCNIDSDERSYGNDE